MKIAILGFGREGKAVLKFLKKSKQYKTADISVLDQKFDKNYLKNLDDFDIIFRSPGIPYNLLEIQKAIKNSVIFSSATDLFFKNAEKIGCRIIGITGTKGKGTTSTLLYKILKAAGKDVCLVGNIGKPAIEILNKLNKKSIVIFELSSFQLQDSKYSPNIAVVLNIFEDHLDSHKNFNEYVNAKAQIARFQKKSDKIFYDETNKWSRWIASKSKGIKNPILTNNFKLFKQNDLKISGEHNFKNAAIAAIIAQSLGIKNKIIEKAVKNFKGMEHRLEFVKNINNIKFYNDSASTNPYTAAAAICAFPNQFKILIAGGKDKNLDYAPFADALENSNTKLIILFGENKNKIKKQIAKSKAQIVLVENLESAVNLSYKTAKFLISNSYTLSPIIIFSPGSASFDMFKDYKDRGKKFKKIIMGLK